MGLEVVCPFVWVQMIHSWGEDCSASWAIVVWSSTTRSAARTLSQTGVKTEAVRPFRRHGRVASDFVGTVDGDQDLERARYSKQVAPGDSHRQRLEYSRPDQRLSTEAGSGPGTVRESHTPREISRMCTGDDSGPSSRQGENRQTRIFGLRGNLHGVIRLIPPRNLPRPELSSELAAVERMQAAFRLGVPCPATRPLVFARSHCTRARPAADRGISSVVQRIVRYAMRDDISPNVTPGPGQKRIDLHQTELGVHPHDPAAGTMRRLVGPDRRDPRIIAHQARRNGTILRS